MTRHIENDLGVYAFDNYRQINPLNDINDLIERTVSIHETTHHILTSHSRVGMLLYCLRKLERNEDWYFLKNITRNRCKGFIKVLCNSSVFVQECIAVFFQWYFYFRAEDFTSSKKIIETLKNNNKTYYQYIEPLLPIIMKIEKEKLNGNALDQIAMLVLWVGIDSLNIPIDKIITLEIKKHKHFKKLCCKDNGSQVYWPNSIFKAKIKRICENISTNKLNMLLIKEISEETKSFDIDAAETNLTCIKRYINLIFSDSSDHDIIEKCLNEINASEASMEKMFYAELPMISSSNDDIVSMDEMDILNNLELSSTVRPMVIFLLGYINLKGYSESVKVINEIIEYRKQEGYPIIYYDLLHKKQGTSLLSHANLQPLLDSENPNISLIVNYKSYDFENNKIFFCRKNKKDIFIYCDRSYGNSKEYFSFFKKEKIYFRRLRYFSMYVFIFKIDNNVYFFLPVTSNVHLTALEDIKAERENFEFVDVEGGIDKFVIKSSMQKRSIDIIITSLFFMNIDPNYPAYQRQIKRIPVERTD